MTPAVLRVTLFAIAVITTIVAILTFVRALMSCTSALPPVRAHPDGSARLARACG